MTLLRQQHCTLYFVFMFSSRVRVFVPVVGVQRGEGGRAKESMAYGSDIEVLAHMRALLTQ